MSEETNQLYHYTSMNALFQILNGIESRKIDDNGNTIQELTLRATHYEYLNDKSECKLFEEYYQNFMKNSNLVEEKWVDHNIFSEKEEVYIISFSKEKNDLTMFRHYGNGNGGCLAFDLNELFVNKFKLTDCEYPANQAEFKSNIEMKYDIMRIPYLNPDTTDYTIKYMPNGIWHYKIKHPSFKPEKETRLVFSSDNPEDLKFLEKNGIIKPYVEIKIPVKAIKQIWLAPGCNEELSRKSILMLLKSKEVKDIPEIIHSKHPYIDR